MTRPIQDIRSIEHISTQIAGLCIIVLSICTSLTLERLFTRIIPSLEISYLPWLAGLVTAEALISQRRVYQTSKLDISVPLYRLVEIILLVIITRLVSFPWLSGFNLGEVLAGWQNDFFANFFDRKFTISLIVVFLIWAMATRYGQDLIDLEGDELAVDAANLEGLVSDRAAVQQHLTGRVFAVGGGLVFINGLLRQELIQVFDTPIPGEQSWHVVLYFIIGLVLLSLTQLANRRISWAWENFPVKADLIYKWIIYSGIFLLLVTLIAVVLPAQYTLGFIPSLSYAVQVLISLLYVLFLLILTPIFYLISQIMRLFQPEGTEPPLDIIQPPPLAQPVEMIPTDAPAWWEVLRSVLFWAILIGVVIYVIYIYIRYNHELMDRLRQIGRLGGFLTAISKAWRWIRNWLLGNVKAGVSRVPEIIATFRRWRPGRSAPSGRFSYINLRKLSPRQKVIFYYQSLLLRAAEAHHPRPEWQTPAEYEKSLLTQLQADLSSPGLGSLTSDDSLSGVQAELSALTDTFVEARYSKHAIHAERAVAARRAWDRLRLIFRRFFRGG